MKTNPESLKTVTPGPNDIRLPMSNPDRIEEASRYHIPDQVRNFLDAIKTRRDPVAPVEVGHRTATVCHLGNIAMRLKRKLNWDPLQERLLGDDEASRMLARPMRAPWSL